MDLIPDVTVLLSITNMGLINGTESRDTGTAALAVAVAHRAWFRVLTEFRFLTSLPGYKKEPRLASFPSVGHAGPGLIQSVRPICSCIRLYGPFWSFSASCFFCSFVRLPWCCGSIFRFSFR